MRALTDRQAYIVRLAQTLTEAEISEKLGISVNGVRHNLHLAGKRLQANVKAKEGRKFRKQFSPELPPEPIPSDGRPLTCTPQEAPQPYTLPIPLNLQSQQFGLSASPGPFMPYLRVG